MSVKFDRRELILLSAASLAVAALPNAQAAQPPPSRKRALLVAVQGYLRPKDPKTATALNTVADVKLLKQVLVTKLGFKDTHVTVIDTMATTKKASIVAALKQFLMESQTGDVLYFHYSGHGSQTINGEDYLGWDQTLVPSDYLTGSHANDIRDKELAQILKVGLEGKTPAAFLLSFDSCHSGTVTRGGGGVNRSYTRDTPKMPPGRKEALKEKRARKQPGLLPAEAIAELKFTVISACRSSESDHETTDDSNKPIGSLSYALAKAMANAGPSATYRDLFERITDTMRAKEVDQVPVMEGLMDVGLLGGGVAPSAEYIAVQYDGHMAELQAGQLMGLLPGSKLDIYPADTRDFVKSKPIGSATVMQAQALTAILDVKPLNGLTAAALKKRLGAARAGYTAGLYEQADGGRLEPCQEPPTVRRNALGAPRASRKPADRHHRDRCELGCAGRAYLGGVYRQADGRSAIRGRR